MLAHKKLQSGLLLALWNIFSVLYRRGIKMPNGAGSGVGDSYHSQTSLPPGELGKWQQGAGVESENKRRTEYNLPGKLAAERRKALHATPSGPSLPGPAPISLPCPGAGRSLPPYPTLPGRASSGAGPPPWPPRGIRRVSSVRFSAEPLSPPEPPENPRQTPEQTTQARGGGAEGGGGTRDGEALSPRPPRSLPPASAARALTCSPRRPGRPRRRFPSRQGRGLAPPPPLAGRPEGAGASPAARAAPVGEEETKQRRAGPRSAPRPRRPTDPQPPRRRRRHRARRGEQWWPPPSPRSRPPPSTPRFSSSPSASYRRHQDTRVRLPHPARSERSSPPHAAREGGGAAQPVTAASVKPGLAIYTRQGPTGPLAGQPASVAVSTLARPLSPNFYQTRLLRL
ncbi:WAS/WASL-interacting protein family member 1-like [Felis catus]|uniref:WAS/WASL-interacting protein family member 1-like n=1 Tax=Felis catus TaxID=9685 RepID=UPI001D19FB27|nr:WAS/WASL-interacting protein family member 1-like [Felis catus]